MRPIDLMGAVDTYEILTVKAAVGGAVLGGFE